MSQDLPFTSSDFLEQDDFLIALRSSPENRRDYLDRLRQHFPERIAAIDEAVLLFDYYRGQAVFTHENARSAIWARISHTIDTQESERRQWRRFLRIAAVLMLVSAIGLFIGRYRQTVRFETASGEIRTFDLPDHSRVILNGNSTLRYSRSWDAGAVREVWISGEALFDVRHLNRDTAHVTPQQRFIVHAKNLDIEVLGTTFNVRDREEQTSVDLISGKIRINYRKPDAPAAGTVMKPGEALSYQAKRLVKRQQAADPRIVTAWTRHQLIFKDASLGEIIESLEDTYGYTVKLSDERVRDARIEGTINVRDIAELTETLSSTLHLRITTDQKTLTISPN